MLALSCMPMIFCVVTIRNGVADMYVHVYDLVALVCAVILLAVGLKDMPCTWYIVSDIVTNI